MVSTTSTTASSSSLTDMMVARYNRRSGFSNQDACNGDRPRTWVNTNRDLNVFNKTSRPSNSKDLHCRPFKVSEVDLMGCFDKVVGEKRDIAQSKDTLSGTKSTRLLRPSKSTLARQKDIVLVSATAHNAPSLERFVPTTPSFTRRPSLPRLRDDTCDHSSISERTSREVKTTVPCRLLKSRLGDKEPSIGRHLSSMAGMTKSDIRLTSTVSRDDSETNSTARPNLDSRNSRSSSSSSSIPVDRIRRQNGESCRLWREGDNVASNFDDFTAYSMEQSSMEDHCYSEPWTAHIDDASDHLYSDCGAQHDDTSGGNDYGVSDSNGDCADNYAESLRLALEEQENEMLIMALKLSLQDNEDHHGRHVDVSPFGVMDYEW